jgi:hypothetical protein
VSRLSLELEQLKERSSSEAARLNTRLHDMEEEHIQEKRLIAAQKQKVWRRFAFCEFVYFFFLAFFPFFCVFFFLVVC